jgi:FAD/FMN-containing dehydrogenase
MDALLDTLPLETIFQSLDNYGHSVRAPSYVLKPSRAEDVVEAFRTARRQRLSVTARGSGLIDGHGAGGTRCDAGAIVEAG